MAEITVRRKDFDVQYFNVIDCPVCKQYLQLVLNVKKWKQSNIKENCPRCGSKISIKLGGPK